MAHYTFAARDKEGKRTIGTVEAKDSNTAFRILANTHLVITKLAPVKATQNKLLGLLGLGKLSISGEEILFFTRELAALLSAGIPLKSAMEALAEDCEGRVLRQIIIETGSGLRAGEQLSKLLERYPQIFSKLYIAMVGAGENLGNLPGTLTRLASYIEYAENIKGELRAALYYPGIVLTFALSITVFLLTFGIPKIESIYTDLGIKLPPFTQLTIDTANFLSHFWGILLGFSALLFGILSYFIRTPNGKFLRDTILLRIPVIGALIRKVSIARFARTLSSLYGGGVPILRSMELVAEIVGNERVKKAVRDALENLREGEPIVGALRRGKIFTGMSLSMIATGEEAGSLDQMLSSLADFYDAQIYSAIKGLSGMLEPIILIFIGIMLGGIIISLGMPFLNLSAVLEGGK